MLGLELGGNLLVAAQRRGEPATSSAPGDLSRVPVSILPIVAKWTPASRPSSRGERPSWLRVVRTRAPNPVGTPFMCLLDAAHRNGPHEPI